jgi:hypothetical protein
VGAEAGLIRSDNVGSYDSAVPLGNVGPYTRLEPVSEGVLSRHSRIERVSVTGRDDSFKYTPDRILIGLRRRPYCHLYEAF